MSHFHYKDGQLYCEQVALDAELLKQYGSPLYVYSRAAFESHYKALADAFAGLKPKICYSVKSCSNLSVLRLLKDCGSAFDVVSAGEIARVLEAGASAEQIVYAGVGKTEDEIRYALQTGIHHFNVEGESELQRIQRLAKERGQRAAVALRLNPDVDPKTHRYITTGKRENKFGLDWDKGRALFARHKDFDSVDFIGIHTHIGSQIQDPAPFVKALTRTLEFANELKAQGLPMSILNIGGGYGISYEDRQNANIARFAKALEPLLKGQGYDLYMEPGRSISGNAGVMLTQVVDIKQSGSRRFIIVDAGMNDLIRPSLYEAFHEIWPVESARDPKDIAPEDRGEPADIVGPICESGDFLGLDRAFPELSLGQVLCVFSAGAYGFSMASNYNSRGRACELLIEGDSVRIIRRREGFEDLVRLERF